MKSAKLDREDLVSGEKQANHLRHRNSRSVAEMTIHGVTHHSAQLFTTLRLGHDRVANRRGDEASACLVLLNIEDDFVHESTIIQSISCGEPDSTSGSRPPSPDYCPLTSANYLRLLVSWSFSLLVSLHALRKEAA